ncbi:MAG: peptide deformylase [Planctomycetota bacterium]|jgi:peptide deformylase
MAVRPIRQLGDPVLRVPAAPVPEVRIADPEFQRLVDDLIETMHAAHGAGLAAPQIGESVAVCAIHVRQNPRYPYKPNYPLTVLVNPRVTALDDTEETIFEGCLSVPDLRGEVRRRMHVRVDALDRHGGPVSFEAHGLTAGTMQHEIDHLHGRLFVDQVEDTTTLCTWDNYRAHHAAAFETRARAIVARYGS